MEQDSCGERGTALLSLTLINSSSSILPSGRFTHLKMLLMMSSGNSQDATGEQGSDKKKDTEAVQLRTTRVPVGRLNPNQGRPVTQLGRPSETAQALSENRPTGNPGQGPCLEEGGVIHVPSGQTEPCKCSKPY